MLQYSRREASFGPAPFDFARKRQASFALVVINLLKFVRLSGNHKAFSNVKIVAKSWFCPQS